MAACQIMDFDCSECDLCVHCKGTGEEQPIELCANCDHCFDDVLGWSTGIEPVTLSQLGARMFHQ